MKDVVFGQIYPVDSPVHRTDARAKFIIMILYIVTVIFVDSFMQFAVIALALLIVVLMSRVPPLKVLSSLKAIIVLAVVTFIFTVLLNKGNGAEAETLYVEFGPFCICGTGLMTGGLIICRIVLLVVGPTMLTLTTTPVDGGRYRVPPVAAEAAQAARTCVRYDNEHSSAHDTHAVRGDAAGHERAEGEGRVLRSR